MKSIKSALLGLAMLGVAATALAQNEQFIPMLSYRVGPYAAGGSGFFGGFIDYVNLINARRRRQRRQAHLGRVRDRVQRRPRRRVLRAAQEEGRRRDDGATRCRPASPTR